jgi:hypothetical protein
MGFRATPSMGLQTQFENKKSLSGFMFGMKKRQRLPPAPKHILPVALLFALEAAGRAICIFRQLYLSLHMPVLSEGGVDLQLGRQNVPIGYETLMAPYRPMYSDTYFWIHFQVGSTSAVANWHATKQLDLLAGVIMGYNTFFDLRGDSPCYLAKAIYSIDREKQTKVSGAVFTGPQPFPVATGHLGSWQTGAGGSSDPQLVSPVDPGIPGLWCLGFQRPCG